MIDFIGDIHGHADALEALLAKLGYTQRNGAYTHPSRTVLFVGDYIDRGPKIRETLHLVRAMVDRGSAVALMGNHEYNALCFHFQESAGGHLRPHLIKNIIQHYCTLRQFQNRQGEYEEYLEWFKSLPLYYETDTFRAVHACWKAPNIDSLRQNLVNDRLTDALIRESVKLDSPLYLAVEQTLKGIELAMPDGQDFTDAEGNIRTEMRAKWWEDPAEMTYRSISVETLDKLPQTPVDLDGTTLDNYYDSTQKPVFFGHYWLNGTPSLQKPNVCCLDYSIAKKGQLVAYRFDGEQSLDVGKLVAV